MDRKENKEKNGRRDWYKLDLSAIVYPTLQRRDFSSVYRLSVVLKEEIKPDILQKALDLTLPRFPTYKAAIRKGLFWRYLEPNDRPGPFVREDVKNPCQPMHFKADNRYLVRVYYFRNRISLEAHHSLGDGTGGMCVLQTLTATYLRLLGHTEIENGGFVLDINQAPAEGELEDAYMRYANAKVCPPRLQEKAYRVRGTAEPFYTLNIIDGIMSVSEVMAVAKKYNATLLQFSTSEVYGDPEVHPQVETYRGCVNPIGIRSCYDEGKRCAEALCFDYHREFGVKIKVIRIFNTYGPNMDPEDGRVVSNFIMQALRGQDLTVYGDGTQTRSFQYVDDLIEGIVRMMNDSRPDFLGPVNLGNPGEFTMLELAQKVLQHTGSQSKLVFKPLPGDDPTRRRADITVAKRELKGWEPKIALDEGLEKSIAYFRTLV